MTIVSISLPSGILLHTGLIEDFEVEGVVSELEKMGHEVTTRSFDSGQETLMLWRQLQSGQKHMVTSAVIALLEGATWLENELDEFTTLIRILVEAHQSGDKDNLPEEFVSIMEHKLKVKKDHLQPSML